MSSKRKVSFTHEFKKNVKNLAKKYRKIKSDLTPYLQRLESGELPGDQIQGINLQVFKARIPNGSANKGKQGGFRLVYYLKVEDEITLLTIYSKNTRQDISSEDIVHIIENHK